MKRSILVTTILVAALGISLKAQTRNLKPAIKVGTRIFLRLSQQDFNTMYAKEAPIVGPFTASDQAEAWARAQAYARFATALDEFEQRDPALYTELAARYGFYKTNVLEPSWQVFTEQR